VPPCAPPSRFGLAYSNCRAIYRMWALAAPINEMVFVNLVLNGPRTYELLRISLLRSSLNRETEMPEKVRDPSEEVVVSSLLNMYILPSLAKRGGQVMVCSSPPPYVESRRGGLLMRRRALLILASMGLGVLLLGGVALADTIDGTSGTDDLVGTDNEDVIHASGGADYVSGLAAPDLLYAGAGNDTVVGREGNDRIYGNAGADMLFGNESNDTIYSAGDQTKDVVKCGIGNNDTAYVDKVDLADKNCENVYLLVRQERSGEEA
jgi:hypothetical protein